MMMDYYPLNNTTTLRLCCLCVFVCVQDLVGDAVKREGNSFRVNEQ